jgi:hypothetical protein
MKTLEHVRATQKLSQRLSCSQEATDCFASETQQSSWVRIVKTSCMETSSASYASMSLSSPSLACRSASSAFWWIFRRCLISSWLSSRQSCLKRCAPQNAGPSTLKGAKSGVSWLVLELAEREIDAARQHLRLPHKLHQKTRTLQKDRC